MIFFFLILKSGDLNSLADYEWQRARIMWEIVPKRSHNCMYSLHIYYISVNKHLAYSGSCSGLEIHSQYDYIQKVML